MNIFLKLKDSCLVKTLEEGAFTKRGAWRKVARNTARALRHPDPYFGIYYTPFYQGAVVGAVFCKSCKNYSYKETDLVTGKTHCIPRYKITCKIDGEYKWSWYSSAFPLGWSIQYADKFNVPVEDRRIFGYKED